MHNSSNGLASYCKCNIFLFYYSTFSNYTVNSIEGGGDGVGNNGPVGKESTPPPLTQKSTEILGKGGPPHVPSFGLGADFP